MKEHTVSCLNLEQIQVTTVCRQFSEFIHVTGNQKATQQATGILFSIDSYVLRHKVKSRSVISSLSLDKDASKTARPQSAEEEVIPRFTLGLQSRPRRHLVPLPWQLDSTTYKDSSNEDFSLKSEISFCQLNELDRPKTASSSQDSVSTAGSAESDEKFRKVVNVLDPHSLCYEDDEDMQEDEVEDPSDVSTHKPVKALGREGLKRGSQSQMLGMRRKFSSRREYKIKPLPPVK